MFNFVGYGASLGQKAVEAIIGPTAPKTGTAGASTDEGKRQAAGITDAPETFQGQLGRALGEGIGKPLGWAFGALLVLFFLVNILPGLLGRAAAKVSEAVA
ncbi:MAG: hypothetical protein HYZ75_00795 [Elusimicrobia bacterium]|nr:hypothetical protein [Elusimicrobiota bacterium]